MESHLSKVDSTDEDENLNPDWEPNQEWLRVKHMH